MSMPEFMNNVQFVANMVEPPADDEHRRELADLWLTPAIVADYSDSDFSNLPPDQKDRLRKAVERFRKSADKGKLTSNLTPKVIADALCAFGTIRVILMPLMGPERETVRLAIWRAWQEGHVQDCIPTFDFQLSDDSTGDPAVWIWMILSDDMDIEAEETHEKLSRLRSLIHKNLREAGIDRWPFNHVRTRSEVKELMTEAAA